MGWAHAGATPGDPGGQHNYNPTTHNNTANMYTIAWKHHFDKQLYWYIDSAKTFNGTNAHYDLGAGGRGVTTDCHDGTTQAFIDYSSAGPTTWGGCRPFGFPRACTTPSERGLRDDWNLAARPGVRLHPRPLPIRFG